MRPQPQSDSHRSSDFVERLKHGLGVERQVGFDLFELGYWVAWGNPPTKALDPAAYEAARPDLIVSLSSGPIGLEVKGRTVDFSGPQDFPYPLALVESIRRWDTRTDHPAFVLLVSEGPKAGRLVIPSRTRHRWIQSMANNEMCWGASPSCWRTWESLLERLKQTTASRLS